jgi:glycosyltransferase involved in cell wall biosynthesis
MNITVILCTYNRCQSLSKALESLAASQLQASCDWEVLVVDNNSNDSTREVVLKLCNRVPDHFRYIFEARPGKSYALNTGIKNAKGQVLAFTDDDVVVEPDWLQNLTASLHGDAWAGASGRTLPEREFSPPRWIPRKGLYALAPLAVFDRGTEPFQLAETPFGNNMAFRKVMFEKYGGFRVDLGPCAGSAEAQKSEDSEFGLRLVAAGERLRYEPSAVLYHAVPQNRLQKDYFLDWWYDKARADIRGFGVEPGTRWFLGGVPLYLFRRLGVWGLRWMFAIEPSTRFANKIKVWGIAGMILECRRKAFEANAKRNIDV